MKYFFLIVFLLYVFCCSAQSLGAMQIKALLDTAAFDKWSSSVEQPQISHDGKYASYLITNLPSGSKTLFLKSVDNSWNVQIASVPLGEFSPDNKRFVFLTSNDSLGIVSLGQSSIEYIPHVVQFRLFLQDSIASIAYWSKMEKEIVIQSLINENKKTFDSVENFWPIKDKRILTLEYVSGAANADERAMCIVDLKNDTKQTIWRGIKPKTVIVDNANDQIAFAAKTNLSGGGGNSIWYYKSGYQNAILLTDSESKAKNNADEIDNIVDFSKDGNKIFFTLKKINVNEKSSAKPTALVLWSYTDLVLQSEQLKQIKDPPYAYNLAVIVINGKKVIRLIKDNEMLIESFPNPSRQDNYILIRHTSGRGASSEFNWNRYSTTSMYLESTSNGKRILLDGITNGHLSLTQKFVVYYNYKQHNFFSYEVSSGIKRNITKGIQTSWIRKDFEHDILNERNDRGIAGWTTHDSAVLIYDQYDIWKVYLARCRK